jgi:hypothetical protein
VVQTYPPSLYSKDKRNTVGLFVSEGSEQDQSEKVSDAGSLPSFHLQEEFQDNYT